MTRINQTQSICSPDADGLYDANIILNGSSYLLVSLFDDYSFRGDPLENLCLYDYVPLFYKQK